MPRDTVLSPDYQSAFNPAVAQHAQRKAKLKALFNAKEITNTEYRILHYALILSGSTEGRDQPFFLMKTNMEKNDLFVSQSTKNRCRKKMVELGLWKATGGKRGHGFNEYRWDFGALEVAAMGLPIEVCPLSAVTDLRVRKDIAKPENLRLPKLEKYVLTFIRNKGPHGFKRKALAYHILASEKQYNQGPERRKRAALLAQGMNPDDHLPNDILRVKIKEGQELTNAEKRTLRAVEKRGDRALGKLVKEGLIEKLEAQRGRDGYLKYQTTSKLEEYLTPPAEDAVALIDEEDTPPRTAPKGHAQALTVPHKDEADDSEAEIIERQEPAGFEPNDQDWQDAPPHSPGVAPYQTDETESVTDPEMIAYFEQQEQVMATLRTQERRLLGRF